MDVRELIRELLTDRRLSMKEASEKIGKNHAYLQQYLDRGIPKQLPENVREALAPVLGVTSERLKSASNGKEPVNRMPALKVPSAIPGDKIPVMGGAEGGPDGRFSWNGEVVDYIDRPPSLTSAPNGYATFIFGTSMEPRYHPGEMIHVHPGRPVTAGCYVLVQVKPAQDGEPPQAFVKRLVKRTPTKLVLEQLNPAKSIEIPLTDVVSIHRIVGSGE